MLGQPPNKGGRIKAFTVKKDTNCLRSRPNEQTKKSVTAPDFKSPSSEQYRGTYGSVPVGGRNMAPSFSRRQVTLIFKEPRGTRTETSPVGKASSADADVAADGALGWTQPQQPPQPLPHQPVLVEATDSLWDTSRWGSGASRPGMRLSTAMSGFPFQMCGTAEQRRSNRLVCKAQQQ